MTGKRLVILGASGFVGTALSERMGTAPGWQVVPVIHSAGSAWRLARRGSPLVQVDVSDRAALRDVLAGATHVVNCTRGGRDVMVQGLAELLSACRTAGVRRFVHLSSVMVYGDPPHLDSHHEECVAQPVPGADSYGAIKLEQDTMVEAAAKAGLSSVVLCPPNISGPFSPYLVGLVNGLRRGAFRLLDDGQSPCNLVDVRTLCHAIELALVSDDRSADGKRMFVTDGGTTNWRDVVDALMPLTGIEGPHVPTIDRDTLGHLIRRGESGPRPSVARAIRHLVSSDVRAVLRRDPLLARLDRFARTAVAKTGSRIEGRVRRNIEGVLKVERPDPWAGLNVGLCAQQLRGVRHSHDLATQRLGFAPPIDFRQSVADFRAWYRYFHGMDTLSWPLAVHLYGR